MYSNGLANWYSVPSSSFRENGKRLKTATRPARPVVSTQNYFLEKSMEIRLHTLFLWMKNSDTLRLPDKRLLERGKRFVARLVERRTCILRKLSSDWNEEMGFGRWLGNKKVSLEWLTEQSLLAEKLDEQCCGRHILSIQDSSTIGFQRGAGRKKGLEFVGSSGERPGFIVHPNLLLDADDGRCLGLGALSIFDEWVAKGDQESVRQLETEEKKTGRWIRAGKSVRARLKSARTLTHIADREADFYEMLLEFGQNRQKNEHLIVRVSEDRLLGHMEGRGKAKYGPKPDEKAQTGEGIEITFPYRSLLSQLVERLPVQAKWTLQLPATPKRLARTAHVELRYARKVPLRRPTNLYKRTYQGAQLPLFIYVNVVDLVEILPPGATHAPMHWRIYTSHPLENIAQAQQIVQWYCWRWKIELLFATVKSSGLDLELAHVDHGEKLKKLAILTLMAAVQVIQLLQARDGASNQNILDCFSQSEVELIQKLNPKLEGKTLKQKNPYPTDSLAFATWVMARLGGWKGLKTQRPPGIKTISRGLLEFFQIKNAAAFLDK
jgi:Transposase DDE domain